MIYVIILTKYTGHFSPNLARVYKWMKITFHPWMWCHVESDNVISADRLFSNNSKNTIFYVYETRKDSMFWLFDNDLSAGILHWLKVFVIFLYFCLEFEIKVIVFFNIIIHYSYSNRNEEVHATKYYTFGIIQRMHILIQMIYFYYNNYQILYID